MRTLTKRVSHPAVLFWLEAYFDKEARYQENNFHLWTLIQQGAVDLDEQEVYLEIELDEVNVKFIYIHC